VLLLKDPHKCNQVFLFLLTQSGLNYQVEKLHRVFQGQQSVIVQVGRRILYTAQRKGLDRAVGRSHPPIDHAGFEEPFSFQIVHEIVGVIRRRVATSAIPLPKKQLLPPHLGLTRRFFVQLAVNAEFGSRRKVQDCLELCHGMHLVAAIPGWAKV
jgi:hypothetical protein